MKQEDDEPSTIVKGNLRPTDCLLGRGNFICNLVGNLVFRKVVWEYRDVYMKAPRTVKYKVAESVVERIASLDPPGRFLRMIEDGVYEVVSKKKAVEKACQALREKKLTGPPRVKIDDLDLTPLAGSNKPSSAKVITPEEMPTKTITPQSKPPRRNKGKSSLSKRSISPKKLFNSPRTRAQTKTIKSENNDKMEEEDQLSIKEENKEVLVSSPSKMSKQDEPKKPLACKKPTLRKGCKVLPPVQSYSTPTAFGLGVESSPFTSFKTSTAPMSDLKLEENDSIARKLDFDQPSIKDHSNFPFMESPSGPLGSMMFPTPLSFHGLEKSLPSCSSTFDNNVNVMNFLSTRSVDENHFGPPEPQEASSAVFCHPLPHDVDRMLALMPPHLSSFFSSGMISVTSTSNHSELAADDWDLPSVGGDVIDRHWESGESWNGHYRVSPETNPASVCVVDQVFPKPRLEPMDSIFLDDDTFVMEDLNQLDVKEARENLVETPTLFM